MLNAKLSELISNKAPTEHGLPPILINSCKFNTKTALELVEQGADPNTKNNTGLTLLHCLMWKKEFKAIKLLTNEFGADINIRDDGFNWTPLQMFMNTVDSGFSLTFSYVPREENFNINTAMELVRCGADPNTKFYFFNDNTLLHLLLGRNGSDKLIEELIARGADINAKNENGQTPLQYLLDGLYGSRHGSFKAESILQLAKLGANIYDRGIRSNRRVLVELTSRKRFDLIEKLIKNYHVDINLHHGYHTPLEHLMFNYYYHSYANYQPPFQTKDAFKLIELGADPETTFEYRSKLVSLFDIFSESKDKKSIQKLEAIIASRKQASQPTTNTFHLISQDLKQLQLLKLDEFIRDSEEVAKNTPANIILHEQLIAAKIIRDIIIQNKKLDLLYGYKNIIQHCEALRSVCDYFKLELNKTTSIISDSQPSQVSPVSTANIISSLEHKIETPGLFYPKITNEGKIEAPIVDVTALDWIHVPIFNAKDSTLKILEPLIITATTHSSSSTTHSSSLGASSSQGLFAAPAKNDKTAVKEAKQQRDEHKDTTVNPPEPVVKSASSKRKMLPAS